MTTAAFPPKNIRGRLTANAPLARLTWLRVGGAAEFLFEPADIDDLRYFLRELPAETPIARIGAGSNILVRDGGLRGVVIHLGAAFADIDVKGTEIIAGAGAPDAAAAKAAARNGLAGLEFLSGVPGHIGGALRMNAGAYGMEIADILETAWAVDARGELREIPAAEMGFSYRRCAVPEDWTFVRARFRGRPDTPQSVQDRIRDIQRQRVETQPPGPRTGGSTFKNPPGAKAWELIDAAGCRGLRLGGACMSEKHCNFMVNCGDATAADMEALGEMVRDRVRQNSGVELSWEIRRMGETNR